MDSSPRHSASALPVLLGLSFVTAIDLRILSPLLPLISTTFRVTPGRIGVAMTGYAVAFACGQLLCGVAGDRLGRIQVIRASAIVFALTTIASALSRTPTEFIIARFCVGGASAAVIPLTLAYVGDTHAYADRHAAVARVALVTSTAFSIAAAFGSFAADLTSWRWIVAGVGAVAILPAGLLFASTYSRKPVAVSPLPVARAVPGPPVPMLAPAAPPPPASTLAPVSRSAPVSTSAPASAPAPVTPRPVVPRLNSNDEPERTLVLRPSERLPIVPLLRPGADDEREDRTLVMDSLPLFESDEADVKERTLIMAFPQESAPLSTLASVMVAEPAAYWSIRRTNTPVMGFAPPASVPLPLPLPSPSPLLTPRVEEGGPPRAWHWSYRTVLSMTVARRLYPLIFCEGFFCIGGVTYFGALLRRHYLLDQRWTGIMLAILGVGTIAGAAIVNRLRRNTSEDAVAILGGPLLASGFLAFAYHLPLVVVGLALFVMGQGLIALVSTLQVRATTISGSARGTAMSLFAFSRFLGVAVGTAILGRLLDSRLERATMIGMAIVSVALGLFSVSVPKPAAK